MVKNITIINNTVKCFLPSIQQCLTKQFTMLLDRSSALVLGRLRNSGHDFLPILASCPISTILFSHAVIKYELIEEP